MNTSASKSSITHVQIPCSRTAIHGELAIPDSAKGLVIFSHATHGGWADSKNWPIAWRLHQNGYATLLLNLLTPVEGGLETAKGFLRREVPLLTERLKAATRWARGQEELEELDYAYFGSDVGAAAAIEAAAALPATRTVVCRAGRTDLTGEASEHLEAPVLLIVGEHDRRTLRWNREFANSYHRNRRLEIIQGATHLLPEEGALSQVAKLTVDWMESHLRHETLIHH
jgi:putative phosphoribosyl transferase